MQDMPESANKFVLFVDLDGVLTDFDKRLAELLGKPLVRGWNFGNDKTIWDKITQAGEQFWSEMEWMPDGRELWDFLLKYTAPNKPVILSSPSRSKTSITGKEYWIKKNLGDVPYIISFNKEQQVKPDVISVLVDDRQKNIAKWTAKNGIGILHTDAASTMQKLSEIKNKSNATEKVADDPSFKRFLREMGVDKPSQALKTRQYQTNPQRPVVMKPVRGPGAYSRKKEKNVEMENIDARTLRQAAFILRNTAKKLIVKHMRADFDPIPLPFSPDALEPHLGRDQILTHYIEHHHKYSRRLNELLDDSKERYRTLPEAIRKTENDDIKSNASQILNHNLYWKSLAPSVRQSSPTGKLTDLISDDFGDFDDLKSAIKDKSKALKGNGYLWLYFEDGKLKVDTTPNSQTMGGNRNKLILFAIDLWEHAYYIDYPGKKDVYIDVIVDNCLDWDHADEVIVNIGI